MGARDTRPNVIGWKKAKVFIPLLLNIRIYGMLTIIQGQTENN